MLKPDVPVWYRFLEKWGHVIINLYYDCMLGGPALSPEEAKDPFKRMWRANLAKRADAIAELEKEVWIIEVSDTPGLRAIGQLLTYLSLWQEDPAIAKIERAVLVCNFVDTDLIASAAKYGIITYVMPPPTR
ncbi:hypothetical protein ES703_14519 [subsurface metagenome]